MEIGKRLLASLFLAFIASHRVVSLTSNITGGEICPGDVITFTCTHSPPEEFLQWSITRQFEIIATVQFTPPYQSQTQRPIVSNEVTGNAAIIISNPSTVVSTLTITVTTQLDGNIVECAGSMVATLETTSINIATVPSPPENVMVFVVANGTTTVTVNVTWDPPMGAVDRYTVETSPQTTTVIVTSGTMATLELSYNMRYTVSVMAENCRRRSTSAVIDPGEFVGCSLLSNPNVTFERYTSSSVGSVVSYQCRPGFIPEGRVMSVCGGNGRWNPDPEQRGCREVNCGAPDLPANSTAVSGLTNGMRNGSEVTFQCNEGLFPSYNITAVCTSEETWSPDPQGIECGPVHCSPPTTPRGVVINEVTLTTLIFGCDEGYSPQGTMTAVCVDIDTWSPGPAIWECTPVATTTPGSVRVVPIIVGTSVAAIFVALLVTVTCACLIVVVVINKRMKTPPDSDVSHGTSGSNLQPTKLRDERGPSPVYDEIVPKEPATSIELKKNAAYRQPRNFYI